MQRLVILTLHIYDLNKTLFTQKQTCLKQITMNVEKGTVFTIISNCLQ